MLAAKVLSGAEVTVGHEEEEGGKWPYAGTAGAIKELGGKHCVKEVTISFPVNFHMKSSVMCHCGNEYMQDLCFSNNTVV